MTQRGRKTNSRTMENNGGNALFTMGLITVVALLIVGWVMTQGGWQPLADRSENALNLLNTPSQSNAGVTVMQPTPTPQPNADQNNLLIPPIASDNQYERLEAEEITRHFQNQLLQQEQSFEQQIEELKTRHQQELNKTQQELQEIKTQYRLLEMENRRLSRQ